MSDTVLFDKLLQLRLPAFREGLREQQANPKYAELSFEERLALLVDQECTRRHDNRIRRALHMAAFPMQAALEDSGSVPRAWAGPPPDARTRPVRLDWQSSEYFGAGTDRSWKKFPGLFAWELPRSGWAIRCATSAPRACCMHLGRPARRHLTPILLRSLARTDLLILDDWMRDPLHSCQCPRYPGSAG